MGSIAGKKILFLYRGTDVSNKIVSATINKLNRENIPLKYESINLDKRSLNKLIDRICNKEIVADIIYVVSDEELLIEALEGKPTEIELRVIDEEKYKYAEKISRKINYNRLAEELESEYKMSFGKLSLWQMEGWEVKPVVMSKLDYDNSSMKYKYYEKKEDCNKQLIKEVEYEIKRNEDMIRYYENKNKDLEQVLQKAKGQSKDITQENLC